MYSVKERLFTRNTCTQQPLVHFTGFSCLKYRRERFENANMCIFPTFQETVGSHLKPSLPVVVMATLNQFNCNLFCNFSKQYYSALAKISQYFSIHTYCNSILMNSIERRLINLRQSIGKLNKLTLKIVLYNLTIVIRTAEN